MAFRSVVSDPGVDGPKFGFGTGGVVNFSPELYPDRPDIAGAEPSAWEVIEWSKSQYLDPARMTVDDPSAYDPLYGNAAYAWATPDGESRLAAWRLGDGSYAYELRGSGGTLTAGGGANLFLQANVSPGPTGWVSMDHPVDYAFDARITAAEAAYWTPDAASSGAVLGQMFTGFIIQFNLPGSARYDAALPTYTAFVQIGIADSRNSDQGNPARRGLWSPIDVNAKGGVIDYGTVLPGDPSLSWAASQGAPQHLSYSVNRYLEAMLSLHRADLPAAAADLSRWSLTGVYLGLETETAGTTGPAQGTLTEALQVSHVEVTTDQSASYDPSSPPIAGDLPPTAETYAYSDLTTANSGLVQGAAEDGTGGLVSRYLYDGADNMAFIAPAHSFTRGGSGNDVIIAKEGGSVLDGATGLNWLVGASEDKAADTFFLDAFATGAGQTTWSVVENFHGGDCLTVWGLDPAQWSETWLDVPTLGLTLWARDTGTGASALASFQGLSMANLPSIASFHGVSGGGLDYLVLIKS